MVKKSQKITYYKIIIGQYIEYYKVEDGRIYSYYDAKNKKWRDYSASLKYIKSLQIFKKPNHSIHKISEEELFMELV